MSETINQNQNTSNSQGHVQAECFSMPWENDARELLSYVPEPVVAVVIKNTEAHAVKKGRDKVCRSIMADLMKGMGMDLESMLTSCPYAGEKKKNMV